MGIIALLAVVALIAVGYAWYKHVGLAAVVTGVAAEIAKLENAVVKVESAVKVDIAASITKIKSLL